LGPPAREVRGGALAFQVSDSQTGFKGRTPRVKIDTAHPNTNTQTFDAMATEKYVYPPPPEGTRVPEFDTVIDKSVCGAHFDVTFWRDGAWFVMRAVFHSTSVAWRLVDLFDPEDPLPADERYEKRPATVADLPRTLFNAAVSSIVAHVGSERPPATDIDSTDIAVLWRYLLVTLADALVAEKERM